MRIVPICETVNTVFVRGHQPRQRHGDDHRNGPIAIIEKPVVNVERIRGLEPIGIDRFV